MFVNYKVSIVLTTAIFKLAKIIKLIKFYPSKLTRGIQTTPNARYVV